MEDLGSIPGSGRFPGEGNGNPLQYSCLENPMDGGALCPWGHKESDTNERCHFHFLLYFDIPHFEENGLPFWISGVLRQYSEVFLWNLLSVEMIF